LKFNPFIEILLLCDKLVRRENFSGWSTMPSLIRIINPIIFTTTFLLIYFFIGLNINNRADHRYHQYTFQISGYFDENKKWSDSEYSGVLYLKGDLSKIFQFYINSTEPAVKSFIVEIETLINRALQDSYAIGSNHSNKDYLKFNLEFHKYPIDTLACTKEIVIFLQTAILYLVIILLIKIFAQMSNWFCPMRKKDVRIAMERLLKWKQEMYIADLALFSLCKTEAEIRSESWCSKENFFSLILQCHSGDKRQLLEKEKEMYLNDKYSGGLCDKYRLDAILQYVNLLEYKCSSPDDDEKWTMSSVFFHDESIDIDDLVYEFREENREITFDEWLTNLSNDQKEFYYKEFITSLRNKRIEFFDLLNLRLTSYKNGLPNVYHLYVYAPFANLIKEIIFEYLAHLESLLQFRFSNNRDATNPYSNLQTPSSCLDHQIVSCYLTLSKLCNEVNYFTFRDYKVTRFKGIFRKEPYYDRDFFVTYNDLDFNDIASREGFINTAYKLRYDVVFALKALEVLYQKHKIDKQDKDLYHIYDIVCDLLSYLQSKPTWKSVFGWLLQYAGSNYEKEAFEPNYSLSFEILTKFQTYLTDYLSEPNSSKFNCFYYPQISKRLSNLKKKI